MSETEHSDPSNTPSQSQATPKPAVPPRLPPGVLIPASGPLAIEPAAMGAAGHLPAMPDVTGQIPMATVLSYENMSDSFDPRTRGWLITAGILWILTGIGPMILGGMGLYYLIEELGSIYRNPAEAQLRVFLILIAMLLAGSAISYTIGVFCFLSRRWIAHLAPAWGLLLLTIHLGFTIMLTVAFVDSNFNYMSTDDILIFLAMTVLPLATLGLLCFVHLRRKTIGYLLARDRRNSPSATRTIHTSYLALTALVICAITGFFTLIQSMENGDSDRETQWYFFLLISAFTAPILAGLTWYHLKINRIVGAVLYGIWVCAFVADRQRLFGSYILPMVLLCTAAILLCLLHAFNRSQPADQMA